MHLSILILLLISIFSVDSHTLQIDTEPVIINVPEVRKEVAGSSYDYKSYLTFNEMENRIEYLQKTFPTKVSVKVMGKSREGRKLYLLTVTNGVKRSAGDLGDLDPEGGEGHLDQQGQEADHKPEDGGGHSNTSNTQGGSEDAEDHADDEDHANTEGQGSGIEEGRNDTQSLRNVMEGRRGHPMRRYGRKVGEEASPHARAWKKPIIFVDAGIHAREWVTPAAAFFLLDRLLATPHLLSALEWKVMPIVNPDGYSYSKIKRMWRKNRAKNRGSRCVGVDLNRNFDLHWEETNQDPCSDTYSGTKAFSEPESRAVRDAVKAVRSRVQAYITLHTYGQLFLYPYGYTKKKVPANVETLKDVGRGMAKAVFDHYGNEYLVRQASSIGAAAGGSDDWAMVKMKIPLSFTFELQGKVGTSFAFNRNGFVLSGARLPQAVDECWLALEYLADRIIQEQATTRITTGTSTGTTTGTTTASQHKKDATATATGELPKLYPVGWSQVVKQVQRIQAELKAKLMDSDQGHSEGHPVTSGDPRSRDDLSQGCVRKGNLFVCPHMVFWGSMFNAFRRS